MNSNLGFDTEPESKDDGIGAIEIAKLHLRMASRVLRVNKPGLVL